MIEAAFLDVDGVVADCQGRLGEVHGIPTDAWILGEEQLSHAMGMTVEEVWGHPRVACREFWADLPLLPDARETFARVQSVAQVVFLTGLVEDPASASGKAEWLKRHFPGVPYLLAGPAWVKRFVARPGTVLVDDSDRNVAAWNAGGGHGVLVPRRWNCHHHLRHERTPDYLRRTLHELERDLLAEEAIASPDPIED